MFKVYIIGAGQIGSRHLQALKKVRIPLDITVIDPSEQSLATAKQRYAEMPTGTHSHVINYFQQIPNSQKVNLAIIATTSNVRAKIIKNLLAKTKIKYLILEKILFDKKADYDSIGKLITKYKVKTWVNCPMRLMPVYSYYKSLMNDKRVIFSAVSGRLTLLGSIIHFGDIISYLTDSSDFIVNTDHLKPNLLPTKRKGFYELAGILIIKFKNGSQGIFTFNDMAQSPIVLDFLNKGVRLIEGFYPGKAILLQSKSNWNPEIIDSPQTLQSRLTNKIMGDLIKNGTCQLPTYKESAKVHLKILEPLRLFLNKHSRGKYNYYPFT